MYSITDHDSADSKYPTPGIVQCEVLDRFRDEKDRELVRVTIARPWGLESTEGVSEFILHESFVTSVLH